MDNDASTSRLAIKTRKNSKKKSKKNGETGESSSAIPGESYDAMNIPYALIQPTFDLYMVGDFFQSVQSTSEFDDLLKDIIHERIKEITPLPEEIANLSQTVSKLIVILDRLKVSPEYLDACKIEDFHVVGSLRMGTMIKGHQTADIAIVLQTLPVKAAVSALGNKILEEFQRFEPTNPYQINFRDDYLELSNLFNKDVVRILIGTIMPNLNKLDREIHIKKSAALRYLKSITHMKWFEENIRSNDVKCLIRIMKSISKSFPEFTLCSPWMLIILCHYSMTRIPNTHHRQQLSNNDGPFVLPIHIAFKRILQLLSSGIFLPYSAGITDPCEPKMPIHGKMSVYDQESVTRRAQTLLRVLNYHNGYKYVFGLAPSTVDISESVTYWDEVIFTPSQSVFFRPQNGFENELTHESDDEKESSNIETT